MTLPELRPGSPSLPPLPACLPPWCQFPRAVPTRCPLIAPWSQWRTSQGTFHAQAPGEAVVLELSLERAQSGITWPLGLLRSQPAQHREPSAHDHSRQVCPGAWSWDFQRLGIDVCWSSLKEVGSVLSLQLCLGSLSGAPSTPRVPLTCSWRILATNGAGPVRKRDTALWNQSK